MEATDYNPCLVVRIQVEFCHPPVSLRRYSQLFSILKSGLLKPVQEGKDGETMAEMEETGRAREQLDATCPGDDRLLLTTIPHRDLLTKVFRDTTHAGTEHTLYSTLTADSKRSSLSVLQFIVRKR